MGCFLACFGTSKNDRRRRKQRNQVQPRLHQRNESPKAVQSAVSSVQVESENLVSLVSVVREEQPNLSPRKKVTFDSNVRTYEHVSTYDDSDLLRESEDFEKKEEDDLGKLSLSKSPSEDSSVTSSLGSYPPNHRYQNCRESDDEDEELDFEDSDLDDEDENGDEDDGEVEYEDEVIELSRASEEVNSPMPVSGLLESEVLNKNVRDRSAYVHSVLNPVENLTQWKAVKARGKPKTRPQIQKENFTLDQEEPRISFNSEPAFKDLSLSSKSKTDQPVKPKQEMAVDASLSNWLVSPESTPVNKTSTFAFDNLSPGRCTSQGSNSVRSQEDRPILGALTVEEIRQFSASSSPRKSPSRSPDEMPIIGTVGTYWNNTGPAKDSGSATSLKGIPNTTSKYREDKRVNWHTTPFETRLERALNRGASEA
ncbi:hypothetical protein L484_005945 [Morus notabilis]|uniref:Protein JASON n=1 Tax=Morus notabilis TaxID=981085 RepID=W9REV2_9ROSA|nr:putative vacuolar protein sorting-associated protein 13F [Morus notabilis]EXB53515.1 hypothetical protein L484_005945 [Morus notabilis]